MNRRSFLALCASAGAGCATEPVGPRTASPRKASLKAVLFDAFPIFDPRPIGTLAEQLFPSRGASLMELWRARHFEYQWLRALGGSYANFSETSRDALAFALQKHGISATDARAAELSSSLSRLTAWPDVPDALDRLRSKGLSLAFLSNMTERLLASNVEHAKLGGMFDALISTDSIRTYKPDPRAYRLAVDRLHVDRSELLFVAFAGWDASGAKWFGYETYWVNRLDSPLERLGAAPDGAGRTLADLVSYVDSRS